MEKMTDFLNEMPQMRGVDTQAGLDMTGGNVGQYREILQEFGMNTLKKTEDISRYCREKDWENYIISVHALKSTAKVIGAAELSDRALALEMAGKQGDMEQIIENTGKLLEEYERIGSEIRSLLPKEETVQKAWDGAAIKHILQQLIAAAGDFDYFQAEELVQQLLAYPSLEETGESLGRLRENLEDMDYFGMRDEAAELLRLIETYYQETDWVEGNSRPF